LLLLVDSVTAAACITAAEHVTAVVRITAVADIAAIAGIPLVPDVLTIAGLPAVACISCVLGLMLEKDCMSSHISHHNLRQFRMFCKSLVYLKEEKQDTSHVF
jgi:hypothetical protein